MSHFFVGLADECSRDDFGDMNCDAENNVPECGYDGGDCCSAQYENCLHCDGLSCLCHETGTSFCIGRQLFTFPSIHNFCS